MVSKRRVVKNTLKRLLEAESTKAEIFFYTFAMGATIGLISGSIADPLWLYYENSVYVFYALGTVMSCLTQLITMRVMMVFAPIE